MQIEYATSTRTPNTIREHYARHCYQQMVRHSSGTLSKLCPGIPEARMVAFVREQAAEPGNTGLMSMAEMKELVRACLTLRGKPINSPVPAGTRREAITAFNVAEEKTCRNLARTWGR